MTERTHPYSALPDRAFWKKSVSNRHFADLSDLWTGMPLEPTDKIATAGSCFAQHIGRALQTRGANFLNMEPAPSFLDADAARKWGYGIFSCRYGNLYTARQLLQLFDEAFGHRTPADPVWQKDDRFFDALRPAIDPVGQTDAVTVMALRQGHLAAVRKMFENLDLLVMTLGLTEGWVSLEDGTVYPTAPGTIAGTYDPQKYTFINFSYEDVRNDLKLFWTKLREVNPNARMLLTVSPVPLQATASEDHVLVATTYSKSVLRAVAGDIANADPNITYFPSYEIITAPSGRGMYYDPDWRNVNLYGVNYVMSHFFSGLHGKDFADPTTDVAGEEDVVCDEEAMFKAIGN